MPDIVINNRRYTIIRLLGKGKGGYSYLADDDGVLVVAKQIHHEPHEYYIFGDKIADEKRDYERLLELGIRIPKMLDIDFENERLVKEYIEGETVFDLVLDGRSVRKYLKQVRNMAEIAKSHGLNIDYFPANFVIHDGLLWYVDYECNEYFEEWSFENWGINYWHWTPMLQEYLAKYQ